MSEILSERELRRAIRLGNLLSDSIIALDSESSAIVAIKAVKLAQEKLNQCSLFYSESVIAQLIEPKRD